MNCPNCQRELQTNAKFCPYCGAAASKRKRKPTDAQLLQNGTPVTPHIMLCEDGKYRWIFEMSLFKNPTIFILIWKVFFIVLLIVFAFMLIVNLVDSVSPGENALLTLRMFGIFLAGMTVLVIISYLLYAAIMGGKYRVLFEMDEHEITHKQIPKQAKKAQAIADAAILLGALSGNHAAVNAGFSGSRTEMTSEFARVRHVRVYPRRQLIKVNQLLNKNQVYAEKEDYDFVLHYILQRVPEQARPKKYKNIFS